MAVVLHIFCYKNLITVYLVKPDGLRWQRQVLNQFCPISADSNRIIANMGCKVIFMIVPLADATIDQGSGSKHIMQFASTLLWPLNRQIR
jgi:hypothetical protein